MAATHVAPATGTMDICQRGKQESWDSQGKRERERETNMAARQTASDHVYRETSYWGHRWFMRWQAKKTQRAFEWNLHCVQRTLHKAQDPQWHFAFVVQRKVGWMHSPVGTAAAVAGFTNNFTFQLSTLLNKLMQERCTSEQVVE